MTTPEARPNLIRNLLVKAEAAGTTQEERDVYNAKATELMLKWGVELAMLQDPTMRIEEIVIKRIYVKVPKTYSHEYAALGCTVAEALNCKGILTKTDRTGVAIVGHAIDVENVVKLYESLVRQCLTEGATWWHSNVREWMTGMQRYHARRGFIAGFDTAIREKFAQWRKQTIADVPGSAVALRDRASQVRDWIDRNMETKMGRGRGYDASGAGAGYAAGQRADIGTPTVGGVRKAIGG